MNRIYKFLIAVIVVNGLLSTAEIGLEGNERQEFKLQLDLMNRLQTAVNSWIVENDLQFERPKFIAYMSEELHVAGPDLNIQLI